MLVIRILALQAALATARILGRQDGLPEGDGEVIASTPAVVEEVVPLPTPEAPVTPPGDVVPLSDTPAVPEPTTPALPDGPVDVIPEPVPDGGESAPEAPEAPITPVPNTPVVTPEEPAPFPDTTPVDTTPTSAPEVIQPESSSAPEPSPEPAPSPQPDPEVQPEPEPQPQPDPQPNPAPAPVLTPEPAPAPVPVPVPDVAPGDSAPNVPAAPPLTTPDDTSNGVPGSPAAPVTPITAPDPVPVPPADQNQDEEDPVAAPTPGGAVVFNPPGTVASPSSPAAPPADLDSGDDAPEPTPPDPAQASPSSPPGSDATAPALGPVVTTPAPRPSTSLVTSDGSTFLSVFTPPTPTAVAALISGSAPTNPGTTPGTSDPFTNGQPGAQDLPEGTIPGAGGEDESSSSSSNTDDSNNNGGNESENTQSTDNNNSASDGGGGMPQTTKIALGVAGGATGMVLLILGMWILWKRRMRSGSRRQSDHYLSDGGEGGSSGPRSLQERQKMDWESEHDTPFEFGFDINRRPSSREKGEYDSQQQEGQQQAQVVVPTQEGDKLPAHDMPNHNRSNISNNGSGIGVGVGVVGQQQYAELEGSTVGVAVAGGGGGGVGLARSGSSASAESVRSYRK